MREISSPLDGFASPFGPQRGFNPLRLFSNDEPGVWFEANDANTLFTDVAGTTPATTPGDAVALQLDKSQGLTLGPELADTSVVSVDAATGTVVGSQPVSVSTSTFYEVAVTISNYVSGSVRLEFKSGQNTSYFNASETFTLTPGVSGNVQFRTLGTTDLDVAISVRELPGNHRTQATTAARPLYALHPVGGVRNLLEYTEDLTALPGSVRFAVSLSDGITSPVGNSTLVTLLPGTASRIRYSPTGLSAGETYTASAYLNANDSNFFYFEFFGYGLPRNNVWFDIANGTVGTQESDIDNATIESFGNGWYRVSATITLSADAVGEVYLGFSTADNSTASASGSMYLDGPQLEQSSTATNYQRVGSFLDVSEEGKARRGRIWYNGTSHFMETGTITPGTDKVQVFAGVRPLQSAIRGVIAGYRIDGFQQVQLEAPGNFGNVSFNSNLGVVAPQINATYTAPNSFTITAIGDVDFQQLRLNGAVEATSTGATGTQNHPAAALEFGRRASNGDRYFNGYEDTSIVRFGPNLDASVIGKVESYVASKTPEPTL